MKEYEENKNKPPEPARGRRPRGEVEADKGGGVGGEGGCCAASGSAVVSKVQAPAADDAPAGTGAEGGAAEAPPAENAGMGEE